MLLKFSVKNFKSFDSAVTLDLVSSSKIQVKKSHKVDLSGVGVLRNAAIYGANAAGKSNLVSAISFMKTVVSSSAIPRVAAKRYCRIRNEAKSEESAFDVMFEKAGRFFDYGFSVELPKRRVTSEWLYELTKPSTGSSAGKLVFSWDLQNDFADETFSRLSADVRKRLETYVNDFKFNQSALFLSEINHGKAIIQEDEASAYRLAYEFIAKDMRIIKVGQPRAQLEVYRDENTLGDVSRLLGTFDTGISLIRKSDIALEELEERMPNAVQFIEQFADGRTPSHGGFGILRSQDAFLTIDVDASGDVAIAEMRTQHSGSNADFEFAEESDGTKRLFDYADLLLAKDPDAVFIVDEIDRSLHPLLTTHLVELFNEMHEDDHVQLIFTTHESGLMRDNLLRKDEIWFIDRREDGSSDVFPLDKFKERSDASISRAYLNGRYGGIPILQPFFVNDLSGDESDVTAE